MTLMELSQPPLPSAALSATVTAGGSTVVGLRGEADFFTLPIVIDVLSRVIADNDGPVVVDLADTAFINTATVRALGRAWELLRDRGRPLTVRSPSAVAVRVLSLFGLSQLVEPDRLPTS